MTTMTKTNRRKIFIWRTDQGIMPGKYSVMTKKRGPSLAESTIERYKGPAPQTQPTHESRPEVETKICQETGLRHPYDFDKD